MITKEDFNECYVLEWDFITRGFHLATLKRSLEINNSIFYEEFESVWIILGIYNTYEEAIHQLHSYQRFEDDRRKKK